jgi:DNA-binding beta-propeller fold protein YncE
VASLDSSSEQATTASPDCRSATQGVDVFDVATGKFDLVNGFKSAEREVRGKKRIMGPSAVSIGDGVAYVGNRATSEVCVVEAKPLKLGQCVTLPQATDGVAYVKSTKEVWVTTPRDHSLTVLDASNPHLLSLKVVVKLEGESEGYGVDDVRGRFFTNLEDKDRTVVVNLKNHRVEAIWKPECGETGPRGLAVDPARDFVIVACTDHVQVLDAGHEGTLLGRLDTGAGVDNVDYLADGRLLYVAAGRAARLTIAKVDDQGRFTIAATGSTAEGARNAVADAHCNAYVADPANARLLVFPFTP